MRKRAVLAIGGNSLIRAKDKQSFADQMAAVTETCRQIADLVESGYEVVVTHGNGPQVGFLLIKSHLARNRMPETPLDAANAQTQAEVGYMIQQALGNELNRRGLNGRETEPRMGTDGRVSREGARTQKRSQPQRHRVTESEMSSVENRGVRGVVTVVTQVLVDPADPAFENPSKPVGPFYTKGEANALQKELGWVMREDAGRGFRRLVPSPRPIEVLEQQEIEELLDAGFVVVACGGGGIPVVRERATEKSELRTQNAAGMNPEASGGGLLRGVAAVIDKDLASSLLARNLAAQVLVVSTAVEQVYLYFGKPNQRALSDVTTGEMRRYLAQGQFPDGSMGPKVEAALDFLQSSEVRRHKSQAEQETRTAKEETRRSVVITDPEHITQAMRGEAGTRITE